MKKVSRKDEKNKVFEEEKYFGRKMLEEFRKKKLKKM